MTKNLIGAFFFLATGALVTPAFATDVACSTSGADQTLSATAADPVIGTGNGCTAVNSNFQNFNVSGGTGSFPPVSGNGAAAIEFPTATINSGANYSLAFQTTGTANTQGNIGATCNADTWCDTGSASTRTQTITYFAQATGGHDYFSITLADGTVQDATLLAGNSVKVQENFCIGAATTVGCADPDAGYLLVTYSNAATGAMTPTVQICTPNAATACTLGTAVAGTSVSFAFSGTTEVAVSDLISLTTATGEGRTNFIDSFTNTFDEAAPEPSTVVLLGSALAGLGLLQWRRRKA